MGGGGGELKKKSALSGGMIIKNIYCNSCHE